MCLTWSINMNSFQSQEIQSVCRFALRPGPNAGTYRFSDARPRPFSSLIAPSSDSNQLTNEAVGAECVF